MSGLLAAIMLRRRGWQIDVFERVSGELAGRGAGIVAQPEVIARLTALGLDVRDVGVAIRERRLLDAAGQVTFAGARAQIMTAWERLYRMLRDSLPAGHYHRGRELISFDHSGGGVTAYFADGGTAEGDVLSVQTGCARPCGNSASRHSTALCGLYRMARADTGDCAAADIPPRFV